MDRIKWNRERCENVPWHVPRICTSFSPDLYLDWNIGDPIFYQRNIQNTALDENYKILSSLAAGQRRAEQWEISEDQSMSLNVVIEQKIKKIGAKGYGCLPHIRDRLQVYASKIYQRTYQVVPEPAVFT
jgi:hypothetical protein